MNPDECIDCALCEPECPVDAIYSEDELPEDQIEFLMLNKDLSYVFPNIAESKSPLAEAEEWKSKNKKREFLETRWPAKN